MSEVNHKKRDIIVITTVATLGVAILALIATCIIGRDQICSFFQPTYAMVVVPNLDGLSTSAARSKLASNGFTVGTVTNSYDYDAAYNTVCEQSIESGIQVAYGTTINITRSIGAKPISVGDYVYFDGGRIYLSTTGSEGVNKPNSTNTGLLIITDPLTNDRYGVKYDEPTFMRFGWVDQSLIHQRTN